MYCIWEVKKRVCPEKEVINNVKYCLEVKQEKDREESIVLFDLESISEAQLQVNVEIQTEGMETACAKK